MLRGTSRARHQGEGHPRCVARLHEPAHLRPRSPAPPTGRAGRPDRVVWDGRHWEWAVLRSENGTFDAETYVDLEAREKWFYQAQIESPAMFVRAPGAGSLYWFAARDSAGAYLDGGRSYELSVPLPVPAKLVLVDHRLRRRDPRGDRHRPEPGSLVELTAERRSSYRGDTARRPQLSGGHGGPLDQDDPRPRLVHLLPHLRI
jgi:hypothetical protein